MARVGEMTCPVCAAAGCKVSETKTGSLTLSCGKCEFTGYGTKGTKAARLVRDRMHPDTEHEEAPGAPPAPPAQKAKAPFSLDQI